MYSLNIISETFSVCFGKKKDNQEGQSNEEEVAVTGFSKFLCLKIC